MFPIKDNEPSRRYPVVMVTLIVVNVLVFLHEMSLGRAGLDAFVHRFGVVPARLDGPLDADAVLPLFTSMFLHGGWMHLIGNMWYLWIFGDNVEDRMGHGRFLVFYLLAGIGASLTHVFFNPGSPIPSVGASGAIAAVLGAYLVSFPRAKVITLVPVFFFLEIMELPATLLLGFWFIVQLFSGVGSLAVSTVQAAGGVAYWAHIGGFVIGILLLPLFRERHRSPWIHDGEMPWPF